jgi:integrase
MQAELVDRRRGGHVPATKLSFGNYATAWLEERARTRVDLGQLAETTFAIYERDLRNHLVPALGVIPLQQLDGGTLTHHYAQLLERLSTKSIANVHGLAHRILHDAVMDGLLPHNPADRAVKPKAPETEQPTWTPEEVATFLAHVCQDDADWHALFATIAVTGIRRGEAVGATWAATSLGGDPGQRLAGPRPPLPERGRAPPLPRLRVHQVRDLRPACGPAPHRRAARAAALTGVCPGRQWQRPRHDQRPARPRLDRRHLEGLHPHAQGRRPRRSRQPCSDAAGGPGSAAIARSRHPTQSGRGCPDGQAPGDRGPWRAEDTGVA